MSTSEKINTVCFEGVDGAGKLTAALSFIAWHIQNYPNSKVNFASFPTYWGFGHIIRQLNRGKANKVLENIQPMEKAKLRMASFVLDRLFFLGMLQSANASPVDNLLVTDRGPYSNIITISYVAQSEGLTAEQQQTLITYIEELEQELLQVLNLENIICKVPQNFTALTEREALDELEATDTPQQTQDVLYALAPNSHTIKTKQTNNTSTQWRSRSAIAKEIGELLGQSSPTNTTLEDGTISTMLKQYKAQGHLQILGPVDFIKLLGIYHNVEHTDLMQLHKWEDVFIQDPTPENFPEGKDAYLAKFEPELFNTITRLMRNYGVSNITQVEIMKKGIKRLLEQYPELYQIIEAVLPSEQALIWQQLLTEA